MLLASRGAHKRSEHLNPAVAKPFSCARMPSLSVERIPARGSLGRRFGCIRRIYSERAVGAETAHSQWAVILLEFVLAVNKMRDNTAGVISSLFA